MNHNSDPTANAALGNVTRRWKQLALLAKQIRRAPYTEWAVEKSELFTGIYARLLTDPDDEKPSDAA